MNNDQRRVVALVLVALLLLSVVASALSALA